MGKPLVSGRVLQAVFLHKSTASVGFLLPLITRGFPILNPVSLASFPPFHACQGSKIKATVMIRSLHKTHMTQFLTYRHTMQSVYIIIYITQ